MKYPNFNEEKKLWKKGHRFVVGLDEAGRGPLAGPVVAGAVVINLKFDLIPQNYSKAVLILNLKSILNDKVLKQIKDSKQLSAKQREKIYKKLIKYKYISWGVGIVSEKVIDKINILEATKLAMKKALRKLLSRFSHDREKNGTIAFLLIDGNFSFLQTQGEKYISQKSIIRGDQKVFSIAAASIIAKVTRDRIMQKYHKKYPQYGFDRHKGYGTKTHFASLRKFGPCKIHRKSFHPIRTNNDNNPT